MIDRETQQRIKDAANIVEVVGDYVKLTRRGANYMGLCPFHNERTPSFSVSPRRNFCHCFSCKKGGSPVNFLMEKEGIGYTEALLLLAKKYNIPVEQKELSEEERQRLSEREAMFVANEWAMNFFHSTLYDTEEGRDVGLAYLYSRGITDEAIKKYKLGYSPDRGDALLSEARKAGFDMEVLKNIGLVGTSQSGHEYDKFRGRVIFPIRNASGKTVAFGGRALRAETAKYINSPETLLYKKSNELYGIYEAKAEIIKLERVFLMEGYLDVIGSWQAGIRNAVASSGTALTESQIALIHRFTDNVTLIYDGDSAGIKASLRGIDMLLSQKLHVKVLLLPEGEDPDSFARKHTPEEFMAFIETHQTDFIQYKLKALLSSADDNPQEISNAIGSVVESIACIPDEIERISYIKECSRIVEIDEKVISKQVAKALLNQKSNGERRLYQDFSSSVKLPVQNQEIAEPAKPEKSSFQKQEQEIIKNCIRYGFLNLKSDADNSLKSVIDYVGDEMGADGLTFSCEIFRQIFGVLKNRQEDFENEYRSYEEVVDQKLSEELSEFRDVLRRAGGSLSKLKKEEEKFLKSQEGRREEMMKQFAIDFSVDFLINHEDGGIRQVANELVAERHSLSAIYSSGGNEVKPEEDRLEEIVPRALSELRAEILNKKVLEMQEEIEKAIQNNDTTRQMEIMGKLSKLLYIRSRIAENLGERIISPR